MKPSDSANQIAAQIRNAVYGKEIRNLLAQIAELAGIQVDRVDTLLSEVPQPEEMVDARQGYSLLLYNLLDKDERIANKAEQAYVDSVVSNLSDGSPKGVFYSYKALIEQYPNGVPGVFLVYDTVHTDGAHSYFWNGELWEDIGLYQGVEIGDGSIVTAKYKDGSVTKEKLDADLQEQVTDVWEEKRVLYALVDSEGRAALSILENGDIEVHRFADSTINDAALEGLSEMDPETSGMSWGIVDSEGRMSELMLDQQGQIPEFILKSWKARMDKGEELKEFVFWGDSLTAGAGGNGTTYPSVFTQVTGVTSYNMGVGGESSRTIAARQGGHTFIVNNFTIPSDTSKVKIADYSNPLKDNAGVTVMPLRQGTGGINPVTINGVVGDITATQTSSTSTDLIYYFNRRTIGDQVIIDRPTPVITNGQVAHVDKIPVIFIGQNGGYSSDEELVDQVQNMINFSNSNKYIVLGLTSNTAAARANMETLMARKFGRHYINLREYLSKYGLQDVGITPTDADNAAIAEGKIPPSLLVDTVHFNAAGYRVIGNVVAKKANELGYIEEE